MEERGKREVENKLTSENIAQKSSMPGFLLRHVLDQELVISRDTLLLKILLGEHGETEAEEVEFNILLIQCQIL